MKIVIACGGTGGHLFPGLAVAETLLTRTHEVRVLISEKPVDQTALRNWLSRRDSTRFGSATIAAVGLNGWRQLMPFCSRLGRAIRECTGAYNHFGPEVVLGMGGFMSAPAVLAARWRRGAVATVIHESNAVPGKANRWVGRFVDHVAVGLPECATFFDGRPVTVTGTPVRTALAGGRKVADARERLGLRRDRLTVLIAGGSQGARALNEAMGCTLPWLLEWRERVQFVHVSGTQDADMVRAAYEENGFVACVMEFCHEMELAYSAADLAVARAGAASLTELAAYGLPTVLVPLPTAADNHQWHNAQIFVRAGAARLLEQTELTTGLHADRGERLANALTGLLGDDAARTRMAAAARSLAQPDATEQIANLLERVVHAQPEVTQLRQAA